MHAKTKILVGISGGSGSAVTAALLKNQGYDVQGLHLLLADPKAQDAARFGSRCCKTKSLGAAQDVCRKLDIPLTALDVSGRFEARVVDYFVHELLLARVPNACVPCNLAIRLESLFGKADELGCEHVATGHHAQILQDSSTGEGKVTARLQRAANPKKDQSYFLYGIKQPQLARLLFPLGGFQDAMVARLAREFELPEASPGDPQEICFFKGGGKGGGKGGERNGGEYVAFYEERVPQSLRLPGRIKMTDGALMGEHRGLHSYQIGQKAKLAPHVKDQDRFQVVGFDVPSHTLIVGYGQNREHSELRASGVNWIRSQDGLHGLRTTARFYPSQPSAVPCQVTHFENAVIRVEFDEPHKRVIPGYPIVFYDGEEVLGGAMIDGIGPPA